MLAASKNSSWIHPRPWALCGLLAAVAFAAMWLLPLVLASADDAAAKPKRIAAVVTEYRQNSHADVIVGKILEGFDQKGGPGPALKLVGLYTDQVPDGDLSRGLAEKHGFRIAQTIDEALTLGTDRLQVAGVLSISEHGDYPSTPDTKQHRYPRRRFFDEIAETFRRVGQVVPAFNDKHLAYRWSDAKHMVDLAAKMKIPFMAGSSVPVALRRPALALPLGCEIEGALAIGHGGYESYGFHAIEALQCIVERRAGGETGVAAIRVLQGALPTKCLLPTNSDSCPPNQIATHFSRCGVPGSSSGVLLNFRMIETGRRGSYDPDRVFLIFLIR